MKAIKETYVRNGTVVRIVDGDTVELNIDLGFNIHHKITCRLDGIDAPEKNTTAGKASKTWLTNMLPVGQAVIVHTIADKTEKYGRYLASLYLNTHVDDRDAVVCVNDVLVSKGFAVKYAGGKRV